jgi:hypothetical protein
MRGRVYWCCDVLDDSRGARVAAATTTSALYGRANMNKPLQIACLHVSEDKGRSIGLVFVIREAANKARAQSHSSNASAGSEERCWTALGDGAV